MVSLKRSHFSVHHCVFFPTVVHIFVERLDSCFLTHIKKYMTPIHALMFEKHVKMCVYIRQIKKPVQIDYTLEKYMQQKKLAGRSFFSKLGLAGSGARKPWWEFKGSALEPFFHVVLRLMGFNCVVKVPHKSQCNNYGIW